MSKIYSVIPSLLLLVSATLCAAEEATTQRANTYNEIGYLPLTIHLSNNVKFVPKLARYTLGKNLTEHLDLEGMLGATIDNDTDVRATIGGVFVKPKMSISEDSTLFMRFGPTRTLLDGRASGSPTRIAYGLGFQTQISDNLYWQVDYMHYGSPNSHQSAKGGSISLGMNF